MKKVRRTINLDHLFDYHIYLVCDPDTKTPIYIGQSKNGIQRPFSHVDEESHNEAVNKWVESMKVQNKQPIIVILEYVNQEALLDDKEAFWISEYTRLGYPLLNKITFKKRAKEINELNDKDEFQSTYDNIGKIIRTYRLFRNLKQEELAKESGTSRIMISKIENNNYSGISVKNLIKILHCLELDINIY